MHDEIRKYRKLRTPEGHSNCDHDNIADDGTDLRRQDDRKRRDPTPDKRTSRDTRLAEIIFGYSSDIDQTSILPSDWTDRSV